MNKLLILSLIGVVLLSGCVNDNGEVNITPIARNLPQVQQFLSEHPNADITAVLVPAEVINGAISDIREECGEWMKIEDYYKVVIKEGAINSTLWLNKTDYSVICAIQYGTEEQEVANTTNETSEWTVCYDGDPYDVEVKDPYTCDLKSLFNKQFFTVIIPRDSTITLMQSATNFVVKLPFAINLTDDAKSGDVVTSVAYAMIHDDEINNYDLSDRIVFLVGYNNTLIHEQYENIKIMNGAYGKLTVIMSDSDVAGSEKMNIFLKSIEKY